MTEKQLRGAEKIKETKDNSLFIECDLIGDGSESNPFQPEVFKTHKGYYHLDTKYIDYGTKKVKLWVSKIETKPDVIQAIRTDAKITKIKETNGGAVI